MSSRKYKCVTKVKPNYCRPKKRCCKKPSCDCRPGTKWFCEAGDPNVTLPEGSIIDDFYLDNTNGAIYTKKRDVSDGSTTVGKKLYSNIGFNFYDTDKSTGSGLDLGDFDQSNVATSILYGGFGIQNIDEDISGYYARVDVTDDGSDITSISSSLRSFDILTDDTIVDTGKTINADSVGSDPLIFGGLEYVEGVLYGVGGYHNELVGSPTDNVVVTVNTDTSTITPLFTFNLTSFGTPQALASDPTSSAERFYTSLSLIDQNIAKSAPFVSTIVGLNTTTMSAFVMSTLTLAEGIITSLAFDEDGTLYAGIGTNIYTLNDAMTSVTLVGEVDTPAPITILGISLDTNVDGLTFIEGTESLPIWELCYKPL